mgnify:CR=1 FL=1
MITTKTPKNVTKDAQLSDFREIHNEILVVKQEGDCVRVSDKMIAKYPFVFAENGTKLSLIKARRLA